MHTIEIGGVTYTGPGSWKELNRLQLQYVATANFWPVEKANPYLIQRLFSISTTALRKLRPFQLLQLYPLLDFLEESNNLDRWIVGMQKPQWYGPKGCLSDLMAEEWMYCELAYEKWLQTRDRKYQVTLLAILLRPVNLWDGKRPDFNPDKLDAWEKRAATVSQVYAEAVTLNYAGCRNRIIALHPYIWKTAPEGSESKPSTHRFTNWTQLLLSIAPGPFGDYASTIKSNLWLVLSHMNTQAKHAEEMEAKAS